MNHALSQVLVLLAEDGEEMGSKRTTKHVWWITLGLSGAIGCASGPGSMQYDYKDAPAVSNYEAASQPADIAELAPPVQLASHDTSPDDIEPPELIPTSVLTTKVDSSNNFEPHPEFSVAELPVIPKLPTDSDGGLSLDTLQKMALDNNPTIRQSSASALAAADYQYQVGRSANPYVGYSGNQIADGQTDQHLVSISRQFVTANKLSLNQNVLGHAVQAQRWDVESQRYRVMTDVRLAFIDALVAQRRLELIEEFRRVLAQGVDLANKRFEAREASQSDPLQAEIQLNEVEILKQQASINWEAAWQRMAATVGIPNLQRQPLVGKLDPDAGELEWENIYTNLLGSSPELRASYARVNQARANMSRQEVQAIPNIQAQLQAGQDYATRSGMIQVNVGGAIPVFNDNSGNISAAYREYCRATHDVKRVEMSLKSRLAQVSNEYDSAMVAVKQYEEKILPKAKQTLDLAEQAYSAGEFAFLQVLIVRRTYFDANLRYIVALGNLAQAHAKIDGLLLTGGLDQPTDFQGGAALRGETFSQQ
ncbi:TolC family protein [bacterium]|nr:TolC family protein [bacterium]